jgi:hypothetical protein
MIGTKASVVALVAAAVAIPAQAQEHAGKDRERAVGRPPCPAPAPCTPSLLRVPVPPTYMKAPHGGRHGFVVYMCQANGDGYCSDVHAYTARGRAMRESLVRDEGKHPLYRFRHPRTGRIMAEYTLGTWWVAPRRTVILAGWRERTR